MDERAAPTAPELLGASHLVHRSAESARLRREGFADDRDVHVSSLRVAHQRVAKLCVRESHQVADTLAVDPRRAMARRYLFR